MPRWEPNADERLRDAALDLFEERGFDAVTAADIAQRAGMHRRSFFRYFPDKRDVLFAGSDGVGRHVAAAVEAAPDTAPRVAVELVFDALAEAGAVILGNTGFQRRRRAVVASSEDLLERERAKLATTVDDIAGALTEAGVSRGRLLAAIAVEVFHETFLEALDDDSDESFADRLRRARADAVEVLRGTESPEGR